MSAGQVTSVECYWSTTMKPWIGQSPRVALCRYSVKFPRSSPSEALSVLRIYLYYRSPRTLPPLIKQGSRSQAGPSKATTESQVNIGDPELLHRKFSNLEQCIGVAVPTLAVKALWHGHQYRSSRAQCHGVSSPSTRVHAREYYDQRVKTRIASSCLSIVDNVVSTIHPLNTIGFA